MSERARLDEEYAALSQRLEVLQAKNIVHGTRSSQLELESVGAAIRVRMERIDQRLKQLLSEERLFSAWGLMDERRQEAK